MQRLTRTAVLVFSISPLGSRVLHDAARLLQSKIVLALRWAALIPSIMPPRLMARAAFSRAFVAGFLRYKRGVGEDVNPARLNGLTTTVEGTTSKGDA
jgi:hypothetical protein